jgi:hypothetical protein
MPQERAQPTVSSLVAHHVCVTKQCEQELGEVWQIMGQSIAKPGRFAKANFFRSKRLRRPKLREIVVGSIKIVVHVSQRVAPKYQIVFSFTCFCLLYLCRAAALAGRVSRNTSHFQYVVSIVNREGNE